MSYADVAELQTLLRLDSPTATQTAAMERCLEAAASEIDWELGYTLSRPSPTRRPSSSSKSTSNEPSNTGGKPRAPFGVIGIGAESEPIVTARNTWYRHHLKLAPLRVHEGVA